MSADVQLKTIKRLDSESGSPEKPPAYADIADGGQTNRSYVPDSSQEDIHVQPMPSVAIETITIEPDGEANVPNGDGVRHRGHGDEAMKIAFDVDQYEESSDEEEEYGNKVLKVVGTAQSTIWVYYEQYKSLFWGLAIQFYFALLILRTKWGYATFQWLGDRIKEFLEHTDAGSKFVFGDAYTMHYFAFKVLTVIIFFSSIISMLYYLGAMQFLIRNIARFLAFCLGTSPTESLNAAGNIFIGQSESPLLIRPFIKEMTRSELHAVCTGGFATIAGSVMAAYIEMGVNVYLI
ncbi:S28A3-like protein [Mya arenaria]|uniref:S28A3-like protein n=1 Tax=Mya arenaria TaxID=6604 RepID=A0ABY7DDA3_MYAAR|nr:S28A3-like protein [Mya arenaria]